MVQKKAPSLIVLSAPSGAGKTTIAHAILARHPQDLIFSVSATTRAMREGERDGIDYYYVTREKFEDLIRTGSLIEHEEIFGNYYGTPVAEIDRARQMGKRLVFDIDVKGGLSIRDKFPDDSMLIFIAPPDMHILEHRLRERKTEPEETIRHRLERANMEMDWALDYDHIVVNDNLEEAIADVEKIIFEPNP
ncbi:MAG: guanylate kinase [Bacteroidota bacterium]|nr:guanylate kinase [Bacteroidota bacterium]MDP4233004.1 guanylate kinase [Bacteroidota bacterium]MDP4242048.1 guanylate kinase [Bacteroidota bacterium]MDP4286951.1 guanylate kinase [Bacteroidota bacterium]